MQFDMNDLSVYIHPSGWVFSIIPYDARQDWMFYNRYNIRRENVS